MPGQTRGPKPGAPRAGAWTPVAGVGRLAKRATGPAMRRLRPHIARVAIIANRDARRTAMLATAVICFCFMAAVFLVLWRGYVAAYAAAEDYTRAQARVLAAETGQTLDQITAMSVAYLNAVDEPSARTVLAAEGGRILNIAMADAKGKFVSAMHGAVLQAHPLPPEAVKRALNSRVAGEYSDPAIGKSALLLMFRADQEVPARFVVVLLNAAALVPAYTVGGGALLSPEGAPLALSAGWSSAPPAFALRTDRRGSDLRYISDANDSRVVALAPVPGWPIAAAATETASDVLASWYGTLPLYAFLLLGIPLAGFAVARQLLRRVEVVAAAPAGARGSAQSDERLMNHAKETALKTRLADAEKRSLEAERAKAEFLAHMSHELRTPLNAIVGFAEIIECDLYAPNGREKYVEYASDIAKAARSLHSRIGEILELAAIAAEQQELHANSADAIAVARACIEQVRGFAQSRKVTLNANLPSLPPVIADETAIKRILIVLLSNALRFTQDGGSVDLEARKFDQEVILTVRDTGHGPPPEGTPPRTSARERDRSYGLGLAMATTLARRMGGSVRISGTAAGATAELRLPIAVPASQLTAKRATL